MENIGAGNTVVEKTLAETPTKKRVGVVIILLITVLVAYLDRVNVSVLIADPTFLDAMGINGKPFEIGLLTSLFVAAYGFSNFVLTPLGDRMGARKTMILALALWGISSIIGRAHV